MRRLKMTILLSLVLCTVLTFSVVNSGTAGTPTFGTRPAISGTQAFSPLIPRVASRTMEMQFESWDWDSGVAMYGMLKAWQATGDQRYFDFVKSWVDGFIVRGLPPITHPNHTTPGIATLMLYEATGQEKYLAAGQQMATYLVNTAPRTAEGALYHYEDQVWVDTLIVTAPFLSRFGHITGDPRYTDEAVRQFRLHARHLQDPETGLFFHGWDESEDSHMSGAFWQRGNGWAMAAGAELLDQLPADHPARPEIRDILVRQAEGLLPLQDPSGLWHTVVDQPEFYLETSGAAAIGYALFRGLDQGWLDPAKFNAAAQRTRQGVEDKVNWGGTVRDVSAGTGVTPTLADYNGISHHSIQSWGQGLALLLLTQRPYGFQLSVAPSVALVSPGETDHVHVTATNAYGPLPDLDFGLADAPDSVSWSFAPMAAEAPFAKQVGARLDLTTTEDTPVGSYPLTVSAKAEDVSRTAELTLRVATETFGVYLPLVAWQHDDRPELTRLTDNPADDWQPSMSQDGRLAFISDRSGASHVYVQRPGDAAQRVHVQDSLEEDRPLFSADGRLAFSARSPYSQWDAVIYGDRPEIWFPLGRLTSNELHPAISPDGRFMTYVSDQSENWEIYVIELRRVDPQLTFHVASDRVPSWSPDGREIAFRSEWQGNSEIYVMDTQGRNLRRLTDDPAADAWPSFSPDSQWILFQSDREGNNDVYVMDREGCQVIQITTDPAEDVTPAWSPDGQHILFASDRDGDLDIYHVMKPKLEWKSNFR
ncbi:MAG: glycoside hydrolase family 88 protein [Anaerolineae bacterium]